MRRLHFDFHCFNSYFEISFVILNLLWQRSVSSNARCYNLILHLPVYRERKRSRWKTLRKMEACEIYRCETSIEHSDELHNIISWKNASVTTVHHAKISSDQASFIRHVISNTLPRDSIALDIGLSIFLLLVYRFSSRTLLSVSAKILPPQQQKYYSLFSW